MRTTMTAALAMALLGCTGESGGSAPSAASTTGAEIVASEGSANGAATATASPTLAPTASATSATASTDPRSDGPISIRPGFAPDPMLRTGSGGGPVDASALDASCRGWITDAPTYEIKIDAAVSSLRILVHMEGDATLVMQLADGRYVCNDDSEGLDPILTGPFPTGRHRLWVGTYSQHGVGTSYRMAITTQPSVSTHSL